jgi:hypothetical protein
MKKYAKISDIRQLEGLMEERVHVRKFNSLQLKLEGYTKLDEYNKFVSSTNADIEDVYLRFKPLVSHLEIDQKLDTVKEGLDAHFRGFSIKQDCLNDKNEVLHRIGLL